MALAQPTASASSHAARELGDLLASIEVHGDWSVVESTARSLANALRTRGGPLDEHTALGKTLLPQTISSLLKTALEGSCIPDDARAPAVLELLRVSANLCMDHDENRGHLLDVNFPETAVMLLEGYAELLPQSPSSDPLPLSDVHLKIIRIAVGALVNLSLGYEPIQKRLISLEVPETLLRLSIAVYPPGSWLSVKGTESSPISTENWMIRKVITDWTWRTISGLKDNQAQPSFFGTDLLPYLVSPLKVFVPPFPSPENLLYTDPDTCNPLLATDVEVLEEVCQLIEGMTMDIEDVRLDLARGIVENEEQPCLALMLDFIESAEYLPFWEEHDLPTEEVNRWKRAVDFCKTAVIRSVVEVSGEDGNLDVLWNDAVQESAFVSRMLSWLQATQSHDDLVICAALSLGNLVRQENRSIVLVKEPISITPHLVKRLMPSTDIKVKHGVIGLLKHLAQSPSIRGILGDAQVLRALRTCEVFSDKADVAEPVQMSAINLAKHLCTNNVTNSIACVLDKNNEDLSTSCLNQVLALSRRSDAVHVKSEGARVLVNVIKSLCSSSGDLRDSRRQEAIKSVTNSESATILAQLLGRSTHSSKHVILLNESIFSMCLLALQSNGALCVLDAVVAELPKEVNPPSRQNSLNAYPGNDLSSPITGPRTVLDVFAMILKNPDRRFPPELRANLCRLLGELGRESLKTGSGGREVEVERVRAATQSTLEAIQSTPDSLVLNFAARKALEAW
ncbi:hypothetical protein ACEPAH_5055 [Sanghuangporus vaninii]